MGICYSIQSEISEIPLFLLLLFLNYDTGGHPQCRFILFIQSLEYDHSVTLFPFYKFQLFWQIFHNCSQSQGMQTAICAAAVISFVYFLCLSADTLVALAAAAAEHDGHVLWRCKIPKAHIIGAAFTDSVGQAWHLQQGIGDSLLWDGLWSKSRTLLYYSASINQTTTFGKENFRSHKAS